MFAKYFNSRHALNKIVLPLLVTVLGSGWSGIATAGTRLTQPSGDPTTADARLLQPQDRRAAAAQLVLPSEDQSTAGAQPPQLSEDRRFAPLVEGEKEAMEIFAAQRPRLILALGGGGCKAVAQIGVIKSFEKHHIPIDGIIGNSMGSTIGALYCAGVPIDEIEKQFVDASVQRSLGNPTNVIVAKVMSSLLTFRYLVMHRPYAGLTDGKRFSHMLRKELPPTFSELQKPFAAVTTNLTTGRTAVLSGGDLPQAIQASNAMPPVYRPVQIGDKLYIDGGVRANLPAIIARKLCPDTVVAVLVDTSLKEKPNCTFTSLKNLIGRVTDIMLAASDMRQAYSSDILIYPNTDYVPLWTENPALIRRGIAEGEREADRLAPKIYQMLVDHGHRPSLAGSSPGSL